MLNQKTWLLSGFFSLVGHFGAAAQNTSFFPIRDLRPGMRGIGHTVFSTLKGIETFEVEILGKMENQIGPGQDLIIARVLGKEFEHSGVVAGMSGSPVYIGDKLLGALSYSFGNFTTQATAGITPIESMLSPSNLASLASESIKPIALPLVIQGLSPLIAKNFAGELQARGYATATPGAGTLGEKKSTLVPGGPFAALLITGDMNVSCLGTVTWVSGNQFVGLGHPFLQTGESELPVAGAEIVTTLFGQQSPYKMGQPTQIIGALKSDRSSGVIGIIGTRVRTLPLEVQIGDKTWHYEVAKTTRDTPFLAGMAISNSLALGIGHELGGTYELFIKTELSDGRELVYERMLGALGLPLEPAAIAAFLEPILMLQDQDYKKIEFNKISIRVKHSPELKSFRLMAFAVSPEPKAGKPVEIRVYGQPWRQSTKSYIGSVTWPRFYGTSAYEVIAADRSSALALEKEAGLWAKSQNYEALFEQVKSMPKDSEVCFYIKQATPLTDFPISLKESLTDVATSTEALQGPQAFRLGCMELGAVVAGKVLKNYGEKRQP